MNELFTTTNAISLVSLTVLEIVLGIDNVIFIAILTGQLPREDRALARRLGIGLAVLSRIALLFSISWVMRLERPLITGLPGATHGLSGHDLILLVGGLFLIGKSTAEIHKKLEAEEVHATARVSSLAGVIIQVMLVDVIFSLDSVITAVGLSDSLAVMVTAVILAAAVMLFFAGPIAAFVERHPSMKVLALSFLILIGTMLVIEGWNPDVAHELRLKNYAYFAMAFAFAVELVNLRVRRSAEPVHLHNTPDPEQAAALTGHANIATVRD